MCLAVPAKVIGIKGNIATVELVGNEMDIDITFLESVKLGDYVIVHAGIAIERYDRDEAVNTLNLLNSLTQGENES